VGLHCDEPEDAIAGIERSDETGQAPRSRPRSATLGGKAQPGRGHLAGGTIADRLHLRFNKGFPTPAGQDIQRGHSCQPMAGKKQKS